MFRPRVQPCTQNSHVQNFAFALKLGGPGEGPVRPPGDATFRPAPVAMDSIGAAGRFRKAVEDTEALDFLRAAGKGDLEARQGFGGIPESGHRCCAISGCIPWPSGDRSVPRR